MRKIMLFAAILCAGAGLTRPALPQVMDINKISPPPHFDMLETDFEAQTKLYEDTPYGDKTMQYRIRLPKDWHRLEPEPTSGQSVDVSKKILGDLARFYGPPSMDARSYLQIQAAELDYQITAKNWFVNYVLSRGYTLQGLNVLSDRRVEAQFVLVDKDTTYIVRCIAEINGSRMVMVKYYVPENLWDKEKVLQANSVESFKFLNPENVKVEATHTYAFLDLLRFDYPASWRLQAPNIHSVEAMDAKVVNTSADTMNNGEIAVHVVSTEADTTLAQEIKSVEKLVTDKGLAIDKLIEAPTEYKTQKQVYFSRIEIYRATDKNKQLMDYEYWMAVMMENRYFYIVTMLSPSRNTDFYTWARNSEAFKTIVESIRP